MITRRQGGSDAGILFGMSRKLTTKPTQFAFECDFVLVAQAGRIQRKTWFNKLALNSVCL